MHINSIIIATAFLAEAVYGFPPAKGNSRPDACAKAVSDGPPRPPRGVDGKAVAQSDCSSFLSQIVVPCPMTSTTISISTKTGKDATKTSTKSTTVTETAVITSRITVDQSVLSTKEQTQLTTLELPETSTALTTEITTTTLTILETLTRTTTFSTAVVTSTTIVTATPAPVKRQDISVLPDRPHPTTLPEAPSNSTLNARQQSNGQCRPSTFTPDYIPDYAVPCRDPRSYSTACQALGITGKALTLSPSTVYLTHTSTSTTTPTIVIQTTKTSRQTTTSILTLPITSLHTSIQNLTTTKTYTSTSTYLTTSTITQTASTTTTSTTTLLASEIATSTTTQTTTATPTPTLCPSFRLAVTNISIGNYVLSNGASEKIGFTPSSQNATIFSLDAQNRLYEPATNLYPNTDAAGLYYVYQETKDVVEQGGYAYLTCGEKGSCGVVGRGDAVFWWCPVIGPPDALVAGSEAERVQAGGWDCVQAGVGVECV